MSYKTGFAVFVEKDSQPSQWMLSIIRQKDEKMPIYRFKNASMDVNGKYFSQCTQKWIKIGGACSEREQTLDTTTQGGFDHAT